MALMNSKGGDVSSLAVNTSQPVSVISNVCSNCADLCPSQVLEVQSSFQVKSLYVPMLIIGSIVKTWPAFMKPTALFCR